MIKGPYISVLWTCGSRDIMTPSIKSVIDILILISTGECEQKQRLCATIRMKWACGPLVCLRDKDNNGYF